MRAVAVVPEERDIRVIDHREPGACRPGEVKLAMLEVGVCGTDREICRFEYGMPPLDSPYLVIGHESLGEVVEVGEGVQGVRVGDLAVPSVRRPCPDPGCRGCRAGRQDFCSTGRFTERGINGAHGFLTEQVVDHEQYMNVVPQGLRDVGVLVEPLTIAEKALAEVWQVQGRLPWASAGRDGRPTGEGLRAVVLGAGPVGLLGAMALVLQGFQTWVYSRSPAPNPKAAIAAQIGATYVSSEQVPVEALAEQTGNIDLIYEAVGASKIAFDTVRVLGTNGVFVFTGVPGRKAPIEVDTDALMRNLVLKNQVVFGTVNAGRDAFQTAIADLGRFLEKWPDAVRGLITSRHPMQEYRDLALDHGGGIKDVIAIGQA
jgi:glucose 1-dehydrogenase